MFFRRGAGVAPEGLRIRRAHYVSSHLGVGLVCGWGLGSKPFLEPCSYCTLVFWPLILQVSGLMLAWALFDSGSSPRTPPPNLWKHLVVVFVFGVAWVSCVISSPQHLDRLLWKLHPLFLLWLWRDEPVLSLLSRETARHQEPDCLGRKYSRQLVDPLQVSRFSSGRGRWWHTGLLGDEVGPTNKAFRTVSGTE